MTIGQLSKQSNLESQTIRYYERIGILEPPQRSSSNYRIYGEAAAQRLRFIRRAKEIGFSLNDIKILIALSEGKVKQCKEVREFIAAKIEKIRRQIRDLATIEESLSATSEECRTGHELSRCPLIERLTEESGKEVNGNGC